MQYLQPCDPAKTDKQSHFTVLCIISYVGTCTLLPFPVNPSVHLQVYELIESMHSEFLSQWLEIHSSMSKTFNITNFNNITLSNKLRDLKYNNRTSSSKMLRCDPLNISWSTLKLNFSYPNMRVLFSIHGTARTARHGTARHGTTQHNTAQRSANIDLQVLIQCIFKC